MGDTLDPSRKFILSLDVGSTTIRCHVLNELAVSIGAGTNTVTELYPEVGRVEIDPVDLWNKIKSVVDIAILKSKVSQNEIQCIGISTQRATFISWNRHNGKPYHNFISWKDNRADSLVKSLNNSIWMKSLRFSSWLVYLVTRGKRFLAGSNLQLMNAQVTVRLLWMLENIEGLKEAANKGDLMFGTLDSWLLYKLTNGALHVTDVSSASATGFYDPFTMSWADWAFLLFKLPENILPEVVDSAGDHFGCVAKDIWGAEIPIRCSLADQSAALFGSGCFKPGDMKITLGTGGFLDVNTGQFPHAPVAGSNPSRLKLDGFSLERTNFSMSTEGNQLPWVSFVVGSLLLTQKSSLLSTESLYPLVGWRTKDELIYAVEGSSYDTGSIINWACSTGIILNVNESSSLASSVDTSDGVFFIPAFSGLQAPINDTKAAAGFIGVKPSTTRAHLVRSILESIVFRMSQIYSVVLDGRDSTFSHMRIDGGVSKNDFVCQSLADHTKLMVERPIFTDVSVLGVCYMAGLHAGVWKNRDEILELRKTDRMFHPKPVSAKSNLIFSEWERAISRFTNWYS